MGVGCGGVALLRGGLVEIRLVRAEQRVVSGESRLVGKVRAGQWARKGPPGLRPGGLKSGLADERQNLTAWLQAD